MSRPASVKATDRELLLKQGEADVFADEACLTVNMVNCQLTDHTPIGSPPDTFPDPVAKEHPTTDTVISRKTAGKEFSEPAIHQEVSVWNHDRRR